MKKIYHTIYEMRAFLTLWLSQSFSALGSAMTAYALVIWSYTQNGSALMTAMLMVCSYAPYVVCSLFAGTLSDRWNKKVTMLVCDSIAAAATGLIWLLLETGQLAIWHIYAVNVVSGLMNTVQQPASEVAVTRILPKQFYQKVGGLRYLSNAVNSILTPVITTAILGIFGLRAVFCLDLGTFSVAFLTLLFWIRIPEKKQAEQGTAERFLASVKSGVVWLKQQRGIFALICFLAAINLVASMYQAAFPAMMLSRIGGSETGMGIVNMVIGLSTLAGSLFASFRKEPKSRIRVICNCLLFSMSTENFLLALETNVWIWSLAGFLGWIAIPWMSTNMEAILRLHIPESMQGRIYAVRNAFQFFTIPVGDLIGGFAVDYIFEPLMAAQNNRFLMALFGTGKGSGAALFFFVIAFLGVGICLYFRRNPSLWELEDKTGR